MSACAFNGNSGSFADLSSFNGDSNDNKDGIYDDNTFLISAVPEEFYYKDKKFVKNKDIVLNENDIVSFFGYFINCEDLEKWREKDQLDSITYIIDENNSIYHFDLTGELTNRFELFLTADSNRIALKADGWYSSYETTGNRKV